MDPNTRLERSTDLFTAPVDQDLVLMAPALDGYLAMDAVGRRVWELLESPLTVEELCRRLAGEYDATVERIAEDLTPFLRQMEEKGLIRVVAP